MHKKLGIKYEWNLEQPMVLNEAMLYRVIGKCGCLTSHHGINVTTTV